MRIPDELRTRPFTLAEARAVGLTRDELRGKSWRRLARGLYCWHGLKLDPWPYLCGWQRLLPPNAVFASATAAWLHGIDLNPVSPVEVIVPPDSGVLSRAGLVVRHCGLSSADVVKVRGRRAATVHRTLTDLCVRLPDVE